MCAAPCAAATAGQGRQGLFVFHLSRVASYALVGAVAASSVGTLAALGQWAPALRPLWTLLHAGAGPVLAVAGQAAGLDGSMGARAHGIGQVHSPHHAHADFQFAGLHSDGRCRRRRHQSHGHGAALARAGGRRAVGRVALWPAAIGTAGGGPHEQRCSRCVGDGLVCFGLFSRPLVGPLGLAALVVWFGCCAARSLAGPPGWRHAGGRIGLEPVSRPAAPRGGVVWPGLKLQQAARVACADRGPSAGAVK